MKKLLEELESSPVGAERTRLSHKLIQTSKRLGVRDPQSLALLKRWVRAERGQREGSQAAGTQLAAHLRQLALRLEAALS